MLCCLSSPDTSDSEVGLWGPHDGFFAAEPSWSVGEVDQVRIEPELLKLSFMLFALGSFEVLAVLGWSVLSRKSQTSRASSRISGPVREFSKLPTDPAPLRNPCPNEMAPPEQVSILSPPWAMQMVMEAGCHGHPGEVLANVLHTSHLPVIREQLTPYGASCSDRHI